MKRIKTNCAYCFELAVKWTGVLFTILGMIALITPIDGLIDSKLVWWLRLLLAALIVIGIFILVYILVTIIALKTEKITILDVGDNHHVYVQYGDALSPEIIGNSVSSQKRNILVSVNRCFDTIVDDDLISSNSLHGQVMKKLYEAGDYTEDTLNAQIQEKLVGQPSISVSREDKPKGNLTKYEAGTVAEIESSAGCVFFFLGLTSFDQKLHPYISDVEYGIALAKALQYCIERNQGYPVVIPLIGGGRAQTHKDEKDILGFLIKYIQMNRSAINCDIHIVVRESAKDSLSILKFKK